MDAGDLLLGLAGVSLLAPQVARWSGAKSRVIKRMESSPRLVFGALLVVVGLLGTNFARVDAFTWRTIGPAPEQSSRVLFYVSGVVLMALGLWRLLYPDRVEEDRLDPD